ncbi:MAG: superoxide dismutase [Gammaproteobacteria bacterium]|nr:superoxide dismutase [Gammaproteobacteria bacterium]MBT8150123.1 superoxide dismutase [Gammaproteobacteria bacterium]NND39636.1 superoxide dismutase [Pseudomonadales bacterium]NNM11876.1 superoxide dismutase [Pseudomonadales bacterium]RZV57771.1 MAG: superoxide dismutase [Pseudomonadales bacterium]
MFTLQSLPYPEDALAPAISAETVHFHYHKHHQGYVIKLNKALDSGAHDEYRDASLEHIIKNADGKLYNLAAQVWNHDFYWQGIDPKGGGSPPQAVADILNQHFGSVDAFLAEFSDAASNEFGSGWAWLMRKTDGTLEVCSTTDAVNPLHDGNTPILTLDVWEHAYYLDYQNRRADYINDYIKRLLNWQFVERNLAR